MINLVTEYLIHGPKEEENEGLVSWLLAKGIPFAESDELLNIALQKCTPKTCVDLLLSNGNRTKRFQDLLGKLNHKTMPVLKLLMKRIPNKEMSFIFEEKYWIQIKQGSFSRSDLILRAWNSENDDSNYFKLLPLEIIMNITKYSINSQPLFYQLVNHVINSRHGKIILEEVTAIENFIKYALLNRQLILENYATDEILDWMYLCDKQYNRNLDETMSNRIFKCFTDIFSIFTDDLIVVSKEFLKYWITSDNEYLALKIIQYLIAKNKISKESINGQDTRVYIRRLSRVVMLSWSPIANNKKNMFLLLYSNGLVYEEYEGYLKQLLQSTHSHWFE